MILVYITAKDREEAEKISKHLLNKKLIACTNIHQMASMYWWKGEIQEDAEFVVIAKTVDENFDSVKKEVSSIHSYDCPCIMSWKIDKVNKEYLSWIEKEVKKN